MLLVSEDLDEVFELSDRIVVMFHGKFVYETPADRGGHRDHRCHMAGADQAEPRQFVSVGGCTSACAEAAPRSQAALDCAIAVPPSAMK